MEILEGNLKENQEWQKQSHTDFLLVSPKFPNYWELGYAAYHLLFSLWHFLSFLQWDIWDVTLLTLLVSKWLLIKMRNSCQNMPWWLSIRVRGLTLACPWCCQISFQGSSRRVYKKQGRKTRIVFTLGLQDMTNSRQTPVGVLTRPDHISCPCMGHLLQSQKSYKGPW